jgi:hypothetical protein
VIWPASDDDRDIVESVFAGTYVFENAVAELLDVVGPVQNGVPQSHSPSSMLSVMSVVSVWTLPLSSRDKWPERRSAVWRRTLLLPT